MRGLAPFLALALLGAQGAQAQGGPPRGPWLVQATAAVAYQSAADLDPGPGDLSVTRAFGQVGVFYAFDRATRAGLSLGYGFTEYDFGGGGGLGGGDPWEDIRDLRISAPVFFSPLERVDAFVIPSIRWNAEDDADFDDGRTEGVLAGFSYRFSDSFSIGPGVGVFSELDDDTAIFPILVVDWDITDRLNLSTGGGFGATEGPGLSLRYAVSDTLGIGVTGRYESVQFALDDRGPAPDGIGEEESFPLIATVDWRPTPMITVSAFAGAELEGEVTLRDGSGRRIDRADYDPAPIFGLAVSARF